MTAIMLRTYIKKTIYLSLAVTVWGADAPNGYRNRIDYS